MARESKRIIEGTVVRDAMHKTGVIKVVKLKTHPKYRRSYKRTSKFLFHDENNITKAGQTCQIIESRRYSKRKSWRLLDKQNDTPQKDTQS